MNRIIAAGGLCFLALFSPGRPSIPAYFPEGSLREYIKSNNRFGTKFFRDLHAEAPDKNIVFSPLGVSSLFACLREAADGEIRTELDRAFEWRSNQKLGPAHRLLKARFEVPSPPLPENERREAAKKRYQELMDKFGEVPWNSFEQFYQNEEARSAWEREELWLANSLQFHGWPVPGAFSEWFMRQAKEYFGLALLEVTDVKEWRTEVSGFPGVRSLLDTRAEGLLFLLNSTLHLGTKWKGNTFILNQPKPGEFNPGSGPRVPVRMLVSESGDYPYAKTDRYEAVVLPAENADFVVIMPEKARDLRALENAFAENPGYLIPDLKPRFGDVELPEFSYVRENYLRSLLEGLGVKAVFNDLGDLVNIPGSRLLGVRQAVSIAVDRTGIQADARTASWGSLLGAIIGDEAFHMKVDRPFIFQVRDNLTGALLFMGAVMDPSRHGSE